MKETNGFRGRSRETSNDDYYFLKYTLTFISCEREVGSLVLLEPHQIWSFKPVFEWLI